MSEREIKTRRAPARRRLAKTGMPLFELMMSYQKLKIAIRLVIATTLLRRDW